MQGPALKLCIFISDIACNYKNYISMVKLALIVMHKCLFFQQSLFTFYMVLIWNTTVHRTNSCTLRFFVETLTFRTFIWNYIINFIADWFLWFIRIKALSVNIYNIST